jgi:hypothetical protein
LRRPRSGWSRAEEAIPLTVWSVYRLARGGKLRQKQGRGAQRIFGGTGPGAKSPSKRPGVTPGASGGV